MVKKLLKSQKGMTLVELIVSLTIFLIMTVSASAILLPTLSAYTKANNFAETNTLFDNVANEIISELSQATSISKLAAGAKENQITIIKDYDSIEYSIGEEEDNEGLLLKNGLRVFPKEYYKNKKVNIKCIPTVAENPGEKQYYSLTIIIYPDLEDESILFQREYTIYPLAVNNY